MVVGSSFILLLVEILIMDRDTMHVVLNQLSGIRNKMMEAREEAIQRTVDLPDRKLTKSENNDYHYDSGMSAGIDDAIDIVTAQIVSIIG